MCSDIRQNDFTSHKNHKSSVQIIPHHTQKTKRRKNLIKKNLFSTTACKVHTFYIKFNLPY